MISIFLFPFSFFLFSVPFLCALDISLRIIHNSLERTTGVVLLSTECDQPDTEYRCSET